MEPNPADAWEPFHISGSGQAGTRELESWLDVHWRWEMNLPIQAYPGNVLAMPEFELPERNAAVDHAPTPYAYSSGTNVAPGAAPPRPYPQVRWTDLWLKRSAPAGTPENTAPPDEEVRRTYLLLAEENGTRWTATATFVIPAGQTLSTTVALEGDEIPGDLVQNSAGTLRLRPALLDGVRTVELVPVELKVANRDDPTQTWGNEQVSEPGSPVYAGESNGDMVCWRLPRTGQWTNHILSWTAEGPDGNTITGPSGPGCAEWSIHDQDDDLDVNWLTWTPGRWKLRIQIAGHQMEVEQEVGWRTEEYAVIGQVVPTYAHNSNAPSGEEGIDYRRALLHDIPLPSEIGQAREALAVLGVPLTGKITEFWFGYWAKLALPVKGPIQSSHPWGIGKVEEGHRYWALQHVLNVNHDFPTAPDTFDEEIFQDFVDREKYRIIQRHQSKFLLTEDGKIDVASFTPLAPTFAREGPTKLNLGIAEGEFLPVCDNAAYTFFELPTEPSQTNLFHERHKVSQDRMAISHFATARIGESGQKVNWRLFGLDAPWIFCEIIVEVAPDRSVRERVWTCIDTHWSADGQSGKKPFNDLRIYRATVNPNPAARTKIYSLVEHLSMEHSLKDFIESASGARPEPPIPPSRQ
jgi:hypothetical protein